MNSNLAKHKTYLPAAGKDWLLPLYDPAVKFFGLDHFYHRLIEFAEISSPSRILDIGCGTGSLARIIKQSMTQADVTGIDPDPKALTIAAQKLRQYPDVQLDLGEGHALPYPDCSFDYVVSSFVFHHLPPARLTEMFWEIRRVLASEGVFFSVDFAWSKHLEKDAAAFTRRALVQAGFNSITVVFEKHWLFGKVSLYSAN